MLEFVLIRAASFHHIDRFFGNRLLGLKWNLGFENGPEQMPTEFEFVKTAKGIGLTMPPKLLACADEVVA